MAVRPITDTLRRMRGGQFLDEASEAMAQLVRTVDELGKAGSITLQIGVKRVGKKNGAMQITGKVITKLPTDTPDETLMFPTVEGNLLTEDPRQQQLELKVAEAPNAATTPLKQANAE